ncbi:uncharacterized protein LOC122500794 isoform X2 [Leptopilina heterotoma]|uniref:uncharacterized protein LOC122500794 isoform X2 n=1 Tax=Leptopilina heterotoma TaxID=63436 RepID=UPI001CA87479|nr:uncharacterized protein LOC122500794 isoform X2 [Leptopilina heterotoma]
MKSSSIFHFILRIVYISRVNYKETISGAITCDGLEDSIKLVAPVLTGISCGARFFNCLFNSKRIKCLLDQIQSDWSLISAEEFCILKQFSKRGRFLTLLYEVYMYGNLAVYSVNGVAPIILNIIYPLNETRHVIRTYKSKYFVAEEKYYFQILLHEYVTTFINITTILTVDTTYAVLTEHVCGMFEILRYRLKNITRNNESSSKVMNRFCIAESDRILNKTINCISLHQRNIEYANTLNSAFSIGLFLQTSVCVVSLSMTGYLVTAPNFIKSSFHFFI